jgi:hypothetical protein
MRTLQLNNCLEPFLIGRARLRQFQRVTVEFQPRHAAVFHHSAASS